MNKLKTLLLGVAVVGLLSLWLRPIWLALVGLAVMSSSTAVDRIALYMLPLQLVIFAHLPDVVSGDRESDVSVPLLGVLAYYGLVAFVWLNFAEHAFAWLPYRFYLLEDSF